jgi:hypothetical protein
MKLGEMLVRDGRLSEAHLQQALQYQARVGGRLGTVLAEGGFVDFETLTVSWFAVGHRDRIGADA